MAANQRVKSAEHAAQNSGRVASLMSPGPDCARSSSFTSLRHSPAALSNSIARDVFAKKLANQFKNADSPYSAAAVQPPPSARISCTLARFCRVDRSCALRWACSAVVWALMTSR